VGALGGLGAHILALRKSEPSLEDVFVELVGRGFDDAGDDDDDDRGDARSAGGSPGPTADQTRDDAAASAPSGASEAAEATDDADHREAELVR
jgi:hypothetical protein